MRPGPDNALTGDTMMGTGTLISKQVAGHGSGSPRDTDSCIRTRDNIRFMNRPAAYRQVYEVPEYRFSDIRKDDIVVDIGANVGAFCIRAAYYSDCVFAVEPLTHDVLQENIGLNGVAVTVLNCALGSGDVREISWDGTCRKMQTVSLEKIIGITGGCDFLKCDCEGAEWLIDPRDLGTIRRIEMELHLPPVSGPPNPRFLDYISRNYNFQIDHMPSQAPLGLLGYLHATRMMPAPG